MIRLINRSIRKIFNLFGYEIVKTKSLQTIFSVGTWIHKLNIETIIDVGSNEGQFIEEIKRMLPGKKIIAFEPIRSVYEKLLANTKGLNIVTHNVGLGAENATAEINISKNFVSSSFLKMEGIHKKTYPESEYINKESIQIKRLDDMVDLEGLSNNILLKIDVQGYEDKVIAGGFNVIKAVSVVIIEFSFEPLYEGQWLFDDTYKYFTNNGFKFIGFADQISNNDLEVPLFGDAIFVKNNLAKGLYS